MLSFLLLPQWSNQTSSHYNREMEYIPSLHFSWCSLSSQDWLPMTPFSILSCRSLANNQNFHPSYFNRTHVKEWLSFFDNFLCGVSFNLSTPTYTINQKEYLHLTLVLIHIYWEVKLFIRKPIADVESKDLNILQISKWLTQWRPKIFVTSFIWSIPPPLDFPPSAGVEYLSLSTLVNDCCGTKVCLHFGRVYHRYLNK